VCVCVLVRVCNIYASFPTKVMLDRPFVLAEERGRFGARLSRYIGGGRR